MIEEYRNIEGTTYMVSNIGNVKNAKGLVLRPYFHKTGYYYVGINAVKKQLHRLVAIAFVPNPNNLPDINHKDGHKLNNTDSNLEWCTRKQNIHHSYSLGLSTVGEKRYNSKLTEKEVLEIRALAGTKNNREIAEMYNISQQTVWGITHYRKWKHLKSNNN